MTMARSESMASNETAASPGRFSILVIDDEEEPRKKLVRYLVDHAFAVLESDNAGEGWECFQSAQPDLVICDLHMPQEDGIAIIRAMIEDPRETPVIVVSGTEELGDVIEALRLGASDYFIKPITNMKPLKYSVRRCLEQARLRAENRNYRERLEQSNQELAISLEALQMDQQAGRHVQMRLLPVTPRTICGFRCSHKVLPSLYLSGDFLDYFRVGRSTLAFFMADISGHGASSAFLTVLLKNLTARLRSQYLHDKDRTILDPAAVLAKANEEFLALGIGKHATVFAGCLDANTRQLTYSVGAQLPMPVLVSENGAEFLQGKGKPLGLFPSAVYENYQMPMPESFALFLCSDGVLERLPGESLSVREQELLQRLAACRGTASEAIAALGLKQATELPDDVAVLAVARNWHRGQR